LGCLFLTDIHAHSKINNQKFCRKNVPFDPSKVVPVIFYHGGYNLHRKEVAAEMTEMTSIKLQMKWPDDNVVASK
jgi:hypothetical protein